MHQIQNKEIVKREVNTKMFDEDSSDDDYLKASM